MSCDWLPVNDEELNERLIQFHFPHAASRLLSFLLCSAFKVFKKNFNYALKYIGYLVIGIMRYSISAIGRVMPAARCSALSKVMSRCWNVELAAYGHRTLTETKKNSVKLLPLSTNVKKLADYLKRTIDEHKENLERKMSSYADYNQLQRALLTLMILFSRKTSGEVSNMKLADYDQGIASTCNEKLQSNEFNEFFSIHHNILSSNENFTVFGSMH